MVPDRTACQVAFEGDVVLRGGTVRLLVAATGLFLSVRSTPAEDLDSDVLPVAWGGHSLATAGDFQASPELTDEWQVLPPGLMYRSYLAGEKEPRFQFVNLVDHKRGLIWEAALGGRAGILRYGTTDLARPEGWQLDLEGAVLARVDPEQEDDLEAADFRAGFLSTWRNGPEAFKAGYYHLSSHVGDEFLIDNPGFVRLNYVRDSVIVGFTHDVTPDAQLYGEVAYAFNAEDGALPWEFQYGAQYSPLFPAGGRGSPFAGLNIHTRQDFNYSTSVNVVLGWQWRGAISNHRLRTGMQYYSGPSMQYSFVNRYESLLGGGLWFDY